MAELRRWRERAGGKEIGREGGREGDGGGGKKGINSSTRKMVDLTYISISLDDLVHLL